MASTRGLQQQQCDKCDYASTSASNFSNHVRYNHIGTICAWSGCGVQAITEDRLRSHIREDHCSIEHVNVDEDSGRLSCPWPGCEKTFTTISGVARCAYFHTYDASLVNDLNDDIGSEIDSEVDVDVHPAGDKANEPSFRDVLHAIHDVADELRLFRQETKEANAKMAERLTSMEQRIEALEVEKRADMPTDMPTDMPADVPADVPAGMDGGTDGGMNHDDPLGIYHADPLGIYRGWQ
ncbi:hypothetical protein F4776DRAFT_666503 [Hypoxylon sp. NC0597]|nr:hypothetical protein F4776DRAFT_666503 [Hypoxylon sp. NC0597]